MTVLGHESHAFVAVEEPDVFQYDVADSRFVLDVKRPAVFLCTTYRRLPFESPVPPMFAPLLARFDFDQCRLAAASFTGSIHY